MAGDMGPGLKPAAEGENCTPPMKGECIGDSMCDGDMGPGVRMGERPGVWPGVLGRAS